MRLWWYHFKEQILAGQNRWGLWLPVLFGCGIGLYFALPFEPSKWFTVAVVELLIITAVIFRCSLAVLYALLVPTFVVMGFTTIQIRTLYLASQQVAVPTDSLYLRGRIKYLDYNSRGNQRLILDQLQDFERRPLAGEFRISLRPQAEKLQSGQCVELVAKLMPRPQAALPTGYQFDRKSFYLGISGSGYAESRVLPIICAAGSSWTDKISFVVSALRTKVIDHIKSMLPPDEAAVTAAIIAGEQGGINSRLLNHYRDSGLAHFLSISGLHMSMIAGMMFFLIRLMTAMFPPLALRCDSKKIAALFAIVMSMVYLVISGSAIPAQRAFIMTFIVLLGVLFDRRAISMHTIAWAAFIVLFISPEALIGASFQMSFAAVIALVAFYEKYAGALQRFLRGRGDKLQSLPLRIVKILFAYIIGILLSDLVASLATLPFAIYHFNRIALFTSLANLLAGPVIGLLIMPFTLLSLVTMPFGMDYVDIKIVGFGVSLVNQITAWVSSLPDAAYLIPSMPAWGLVLIALGGLWLAIWQTSIRRWGMLPLIIGFLSIAVVRQPDMLISYDGRLIALQDKQHNMVILPARGNKFMQDVWLNKTASHPLTDEQKSLLREIYYQGKTAKDWLDLACRPDECLYQNRVVISQAKSITIDGKTLPLSSGGTTAVYLSNAGFKLYTVRDYIGNRPWNSGGINGKN